MNLFSNTFLLFQSIPGIFSLDADILRGFVPVCPQDVWLVRACRSSSACNCSHVSDEAQYTGPVHGDKSTICC